MAFLEVLYYDLQYQMLFDKIYASVYYSYELYTCPNIYLFRHKIFQGFANSDTQNS